MPVSFARLLTIAWHCHTLSGMRGRSGSVQKSLRIPVETARDIEALSA
jgi:hypothetical protein